MFDRSNCRTLGSVWAVFQGLFALVAPRWNVALMRKPLEMNYENADELEPRPAYLRQIRALGIGLAAAGVAGLAMESAADRTAEESTETAD